MGKIPGALETLEYRLGEAPADKTCRTGLAGIVYHSGNARWHSRAMSYLCAILEDIRRQVSAPAMEGSRASPPRPRAAPTWQPEPTYSTKDIRDGLTPEEQKYFDMEDQETREMLARSGMLYAPKDAPDNEVIHAE